MPPENLLAIDNGTQSIRALLFDPRGNLIAKSRVEIQPYFSTAPGLAEQHPDLFWTSLCQACQNLWCQEGVDRSSVAAVAVTTQRSTVINLDRQGRPLRPAIVWLDQRRTEGLAPVSGPWGLAFFIAGASETVAYLQAEAEANWIRTHQPEIWDSTYKYLFLSGYLNYRLTNQFSDSIGSQVGYVPFDYKTQNWAKKTDWKWLAVPMDLSILPDLVPVSGIIGEITAEAHAATGIPLGIPVIAAAADKACEVLGSGGLYPNTGCVGYGTTATINTTHQQYIEVIPLIPPYPSAVPGTYNLEIQVYRGYWMVSWFKQEFGHNEQQLAEQRGLQAEDLLEELVKDVPPGSQGLVLQPYWTPGLRDPGPEARGAIIGFGDVHTRAHVYRAILEGVAYALRQGAERTVRRSGKQITELRVAGGGSRSNASMQITANIFGLPASRPHVYEASGLGAAIDAAVGVKVHPNFDSAIKEMTRISRTFEPDPKIHAIYDDLYHQVYLKMYDRLKPLYKSIREIN